MRRTGRRIARGRTKGRPQNATKGRAQNATKGRPGRRRVYDMM